MPLWPPLASEMRLVERERALAAVQSEISICRACEQAGYLACARPLAHRRGPAGARVLLIGQAPGRLTIERGIMFGGPSGDALERWLQLAGFAPGALRREVYLAALTRCDPGRSEKGKGDRKPSPAEVALCRPWLERELEQVRPEVILLVGGMAIEAFIGRVKLEEAVGSVAERDGVTLLPLPHPSGVSRWLNDPAHQRLLEQALARLSELRVVWEAQDNADASRIAATRENPQHRTDTELSTELLEEMVTYVRDD